MAYLNATEGNKRKPGLLTRDSLSAPAARKTVLSDTASIATTGNTDVYVIVPEDGTLSEIDFSSVGSLAANDTNYVTFTVTNLGQDGAGSTAMLAATNPNTTKATGGSALTANGRRALTLHGTAANLVVAKGDKLRLRMAVTGTLGGAVAGAMALFRFGGTT